ncbi:MAG TPA: 2-oxoacid:acceptor oxidoreductase subunit alpha, partial [Candidatus Omnitrophota bacterium]|nr:2-oxoacid:acceptor oxidoreductase subunit alpha [Candidatus Omnitrophota bacterium]
PGSIEQAISVAWKAFDIADKFQVPVFILSDQYLADSYYDLPAPDLSKERAQNHFIKTVKDYQRYQLTADGFSPRGVPGYGDGLVVVDSDEHDPEGHITEDLELRARFVEKRLKKLEQLRNEILPPELIGGDKYETLVVAWGSNYHNVREALSLIGDDKVSFLHFSQVYPLHFSAAGYLEKAKRIVAVENNAGGQFAELIERETGFAVKERILKYDGLPFSVEELASRIKGIK